MLLSAMLLTAALSSQSLIDAQSAAPPTAARRPKTITKFGDRRVDNYFWLREKSNPEVTSYLEAENAYLRAVTEPLGGFREKLYKEMLARIKETDESVAYRRHGYWYYQREVEGLQYPIYCRRKGTMEAPEEILLDQNELAKGHKFTSIGFLRVSPDGTKLAYTDSGYRQYTMQGRPPRAPPRRDRGASTAWAADNRRSSAQRRVTKRSYCKAHACEARSAGVTRRTRRPTSSGDTRSEARVGIPARTHDGIILRLDEPGIPACRPAPAGPSIASTIAARAPSSAPTIK
jgi:hypothetical protein